MEIFPSSGVASRGVEVERHTREVLARSPQPRRILDVGAA